MDASSQKPLVGVSVILINQGIGADTDQNGRYTIINVPLGSYELKTSYIGYASVIAKKVVVNSDRTTEQNFFFNNFKFFSFMFILICIY